MTQVIGRHCPDLPISPSIQTYHQVKTNSTITSWTVDAALRAREYPTLRFVYLLRTNMTNGELPVGVTIDDVPKTVTIVAICVSTLQTCPTTCPPSGHGR